MKVEVPPKKAAGQTQASVLQAFVERKHIRTAMASALGAWRVQAAMKVKARAAAEDQHSRLLLQSQVPGFAQCW